MIRFLGKHAIVLGGSMAGLLAARVLSDHFERVILIERDVLWEYFGYRKGLPQGRHAHDPALAERIGRVRRRAADSGVCAA